jgi:hypothetical protein
MPLAARWTEMGANVRGEPGGAARCISILSQLLAMVALDEEAADATSN